VRNFLIADNDLSNTGGIAQVDKGNSAVITAAVYPSGQSYSLADVLSSQRAGVVSAQHGLPFYVSQVFVYRTLMSARRTSFKSSR
jgi:hypothetical protein